MRGDDPEMLKALEGKLVALVRCVVKKAKDDPTFADQLREILLSDTLMSKVKAKRPAVGKPVFNPVDCLQTQGRDGLRSELEGKPTSELADVIRAHRIVKGKSAKSLERPRMIDAIVSYSERSLNQGGAFLRDRRGGEGSASDDPGEGSARAPDVMASPGDNPQHEKNEPNAGDDHIVSGEQGSLAGKAGKPQPGADRVGE